MTGNLPPPAAELFEEFPALKQAKITVEVEDSRRVRYHETARRLTEEKYLLSVADGGIRVVCSGEKSAFYALCDLARRLTDGGLAAGEYECAPAFAVRGYIEGFYGRPWTARQRRTVLARAAKRRMNTVYYAPKDDPYHREKWREPYPARDLAALEELVGEAKKYFMDFYWCVAPGLSVRYGDDGDFDALMRKTAQLYEIGVRRFGLLLDDIGEELTDPGDRARFGETVNAQIFFINRYSDALRAVDADLRLTVCPTLYHGRGDEYYISKLGREIPADASVFWTGRDICSRELTEFEALKFIENTRHKPLYWDNYPVNDMAMRNEMHLGPLIGRGPELWKYSEGLICNCMEYAECSCIPLYTAADYLWEGAGYDPEKSWARAIRETVGAENAPAFAVFADHLRSSCLMDENSKQMIRRFVGVAALFDAGETEAALARAEEYVGEMRRGGEFLARDLPICRELTKWSAKYAAARDLLETLLSVLRGGGTVEALAAKTAAYDAIPARLGDDADLRVWAENRFRAQSSEGKIYASD